MSTTRTDSTQVLTGVPAPSGPYSHVVRVGNVAYTAGFGPHDPSTGQIPEGIVAQTHAVLDHLVTALGAVGMSLDHVVKATVHLASLDDVAAFNAAYEDRFTAPYPVRTTVESGLMGFLVEIDVVAVVNS